MSKNFYICPYCGLKQTKVIQWQTCSVASRYDLNSRKSKFGIDFAGGDHEAWSCANCGEDLPPEICEKIEKYLF